MDTIKSKVGSAVEGINFFGRTKEIEQAIELLENGNNLILAAPRRVGKTSFARKLIDVMAEKGWKGIDIDLQKRPTEFSFVEFFLKEIKGENWFEKIIPDTLKISYGDIALEFNKNKQDFYRKIDEVLPHNEDTLIIIDEFTIFLDDVLRKKDKENEFEDIITFFFFIRGLRQTKGSKIRWIFCSSISIESYLHKHNSTKRINDLISFKLGELEDDEPQLLIKVLAGSKNIVFQDEHIRYMLEKLGWKLPYFIQILFIKIVELVRDGQTLSNETIGEAYNNLLKEETYFNTWTERLSYYDDDKRFAKLILNELSKSKTGKKKNYIEDIVYAELNDKEKTEEILHPLLKRLEADGYIMSDKNKYIFRSPLLRDFWNNQFGD
jgi:hypothetical protein